MATKTYPNGSASTDTVTNLLGWGNYRDAGTTPATQSFTSTPSKLQIDGGAATTNEAYLPAEIRGVSGLWDTANDLITPVDVGDSYDIRLDLTIDSLSANPAVLIVQLDIGGGASPSIVVVNKDISLVKSTPFSISIGFPIFCLETFKLNGGAFFLSTDTGTATIGGRGVFISRNTSANA